MGDAGMAFTADPELAARMRDFRAHGDRGGYHHVRVGVNARLDTLQAAILLAKLTFFDEELRLRDRVAARYTQELGRLGLETPALLPGNTSVWAQYTIRVDDRPAVVARLKAQGIPTAVHYPKPLHRQPVFEAAGLGRGDLRVAEELSRRVLSLPMHPYLGPEEQDRVVAALDGRAR
jgi:UDP-2-acetamido-2-deoxy-ribo-hexuluronate aminotransferase